MADFNQFGSVKPGLPGDPQHCAQCEAMLADALDGTLSTADQTIFDTHMIGCPSCTGMLADAERGAAWMEMLKSPRPEPPKDLIERILAQTSAQKEKESKPAIVLGPTDYLRPPNTILGRPTLVPSSASILGITAFSSGNVLPFRTRVTSGLRSFGHTMLQPRLAMTAAMAFFSIALTMNLTGVRLSQLHASDLKPSSIMRSCYEAKAKVVRYSDNLRVVYELESRVRDLQRSSDTDGSSSTTNTPANQNDSAQPNRKPADSQQPEDQKDKKPGSQAPDQKQNSPRPNPGSSQRETPGGNIRLAVSGRTQAPPPFAPQAFVVFTSNVFQSEGGLV